MFLNGCWVRFPREFIILLTKSPCLFSPQLAAALKLEVNIWRELYMFVSYKLKVKNDFKLKLSNLLLIYIQMWKVYEPFHCSEQDMQMDLVSKNIYPMFWIKLLGPIQCFNQNRTTNDWDQTWDHAGFDSGELVSSSMFQPK